MKLIDKLQATEILAKLAAAGQVLKVSISEDIAFTEDGSLKWIDLGSVRFFPETSSNRDEERYDLVCAVKFGGFEWSIPAGEDFEKSFIAACPTDLKKENKNDLLKTSREGLQDILRRMLLLFPVFDATTMSMLPLRRATTIVPDTTAVHQGALDFVCRFLTPWARIKIPAIVHMEILNNADNYFKIRYSQEQTRRYRALRQHILSQGGQRTLLRLEFDPDVELDRGDLGADPLRGVVGPSSDPEDKNLGQQVVVRSFADRLIVETARRFQSQVRPDHPLFILTSDQGMAKMSMAEGLDVMFFESRAVPRFEGLSLTGALFAPFSRDLHTVSFADVLWELAVSFGRARVTVEKSDARLELWGIGAKYEGATWQPLHSREDLLWAEDVLPAVRPVEKPPEPSVAAPVEGPFEEPSEEPSGPVPHEDKPSTPQSARGRPLDLRGSCQISPDKLLALVGVLAQEDLTTAAAQKMLKIQQSSTLEKYARFLLSGQLIEKVAGKLKSAEPLQPLWQALAARRYRDAANAFRAVPSFNELCLFVEKRREFSLDDEEIPTPTSALPGYLTLGEALGLWLRVIGYGVDVVANEKDTREFAEVARVIATPNEKDEGEFADIARKVYLQGISRAGNEWLLTGRWLETLAIEYGIHPLRAREQIGQARDAERLRVFMEGSTPDNRFERHLFWSLAIKDGRPSIERVSLYQGGFLFPGTAAVRIRIEG